MSDLSAAEEAARDGAALAPFRVRSYRFQWPADLTTSWAFEMETLILGWYVLVETGSVLMLTAFASLQYLGTLVAPLFGLAGDRLGHRNVLCMMRALYATLAAVMMALAFSGTIRPLYVFCIACLTGIVRPSDLVMRASLVGSTMPPRQWMRAMSISRTTMDSARIAGALAGASLAAAMGMGIAYAVVTCLYVGSFLLTLGVDAARPAAPVPEGERAAGVSHWRDLQDGFAHVWNTPQLLGVMWLAFLVNLTGFPLVNGLMPYVAKDIHQSGQSGLALLVASSATGALLGSIVLTRMGRLFPPARMMLVCAVAWYVFLMVFARMTTPWAGMMVLLFSGFVQSLTMVVMSVVLLRCSDERFRGRITGIRMFAIYGLPLGLLAAGQLITYIGYPATATLYCMIGIVFTIVIALRWGSELWSARAPANVIGGAA